MKILTQKGKSDSLMERAYQELRQAIITGSIESGARLVESTLATQMSMSRTPIREALHKLAMEGLLYSIPRAGYVVETMSEHDIRDLFATRAEIEKIAVRLAIERMLPQELDLLEQNLQKTSCALETGKTEQMMGLDTEFHQIIYRATRSKSLYNICQNLSDHTLKFRKACIHIPDVAGRARSGHTEIFKAIRSKDCLLADQAMRAHLEQVEEDILAFLERLRKDSMFA